MRPAQVYLFIYNAVQVLGWSIILMKTIDGLFHGYTYARLYASVAFELQIFQTAAVLEILHTLVGIVRSPIGTTTMQVYSRVMVVWPVLHTVSDARNSIGLPMLLLAWSITEVIRYSFYAFGLINMTPYLLVWLRYTLFIVLYPTGALGEVFTIIASLHEVGIKKHWTVEMPNIANVAFSYYYFLIFCTLLYIPGFPQMYLYMFGQRKKVLQADKKEK